VTPLKEFMDFITFGYMIDNIIHLLSGSLHGRNAKDLVDKIHPLGKFDGLNTTNAIESAKELYDVVLAETPLARFFEKCKMDDRKLNETNIVVIRNMLYKQYIEAFYAFTQEIGGITGDVMGTILQFEADRMAINITINSFGTDLHKTVREDILPECGKLYPEGIAKLKMVDEYEQVRAIMDTYLDYKDIFSEAGLSANPQAELEALFFRKEVDLNKQAFDQQYHLAVVYAWLKLKEQEIRNIVWIAECISQDQKAKIPLYQPLW